MSYIAYDANGYLGEVASITGWSDFIAWGELQGGEIAKLSHDGISSKPTALAKEIANRMPLGDDSAEEVRAALETLTAKAQGFIAISDGVEAA